MLLKRFHYYPTLHGVLHYTQDCCKCLRSIGNDVTFQSWRYLRHGFPDVWSRDKRLDLFLWEKGFGPIKADLMPVHHLFNSVPKVKIVPSAIYRRSYLGWGHMLSWWSGLDYATILRIIMGRCRSCSCRCCGKRRRWCQAMSRSALLWSTILALKKITGPLDHADASKAKLSHVNECRENSVTTSTFGLDQLSLFR